MPPPDGVEAGPEPGGGSDALAEIVLDDLEVAAVVDRLAAEISAAYPEGIVAVGVLNGSVIFQADLVRRLTVPVEIDFLAISTFAPDSGRVRLLKDLSIEIDGRDVVLVEDIIDTGLSLVFLRQVLEQRGARSVAVCSLLDRPSRRIVPVGIDFVGVEVPDAFVIGYGLGGTSWYRNLAVVALADADLLQREPGAYLPQFHPALGAITAITAPSAVTDDTGNR